MAYLAAAIVVGLAIRALEEADRGLAFLAAGVIVLGVLVADPNALWGIQNAFSTLQNFGTGGTT